MASSGFRSMILRMFLGAAMFLAWGNLLHSQPPSPKQKYEDLMRSARQSEMLGYVLAGAGIALVVIAIPVAIILDRRKKARKQAERRTPDRPTP